MSIRGVILAGGKGTRMGELTKVTNKHLLPVGPWPMVYHPLKKLVGAGMSDILLVSGTEHMGDFVELLGSGTTYNCSLTYRVQDQAGGIAQPVLFPCAAGRVVRRRIHGSGVSGNVFGIDAFGHGASSMRARTSLGQTGWPGQARPWRAGLGAAADPSEARAPSVRPSNQSLARST